MCAINGRFGIGGMYHVGMADEDWLALDDKSLLAQCEVHIYKASGPGGQHRNKVSSAVRLRHRPTGAAAHGDDSRSQHENKRLALRRLRMNIACRMRRRLDVVELHLPPVVADCIFTPKKAQQGDRRRLEIGRKDGRFWRVAAFLLDLLEECQGRLSQAAEFLGVTTGNLSAVLKSDRHLFAAAQDIRKRYLRKPLV